VEVPFGNAVTAVATVVSVVIANRLSSRQSGQAKLWDFRRLAYGVILSELASVERLCDADEWFHSDSRDALNAQISEHMKIVRQRFSDDTSRRQPSAVWGPWWRSKNRSPLWRPHQDWHGLQGASDAEREVQDAWRRQHGPAHTAGPGANTCRPDDARDAHGRDGADAQAGAGTARRR
jgi:hypothetical protein